MDAMWTIASRPMMHEMTKDASMRDTITAKWNQCSHLIPPPPLWPFSTELMATAADLLKRKKETGVRVAYFAPGDRGGVAGEAAIRTRAAAPPIFGGPLHCTPP
jgi:hypothetical protein